MKKSFIFAACAIAAMASCTKNEVFVSEQNDAQITFTSPVVKPNTKTPVAGEQHVYSTNEHFKVYASWTNEDYAAGDWGQKLYMDNVEVAYSAVINGWEPGDAYYWPKTSKLTFAAYSPAEVAGTVAYDAEGLTVTGFQVEDDTAKQYDFMYAERSYNRTESKNLSQAGDGHTSQSYNGVDLMFHHALSSIVFKVKADGNITNTAFTIKKLEILNAQNKGDFAEGIQDGATYTSTPEWTNTTGKTDYTVWEGTEKLTAGADYKELDKVNDAILLPQSFTNGEDHVKVHIDYSIQRTGGPEIEQEATFDLTNNYKDTANNDVTAWEIGKRYTYNILFSLNKIYFAPEVTDWVDVNMNPFEVE